MVAGPVLVVLVPALLLAVELIKLRLFEEVVVLCCDFHGSVLPKVRF